MDATNRNTALASAMCEELARCGVERAVISPGSRSTPLAVGLHREPGITDTVVIDERSAGFLALGAAAETGRPVAVLCTSGTAAANLHPAVSEADLSAVPLILLTADRPPELRDTGAGQAIDQLKLFGDSVRWFFEVGTHDADDAGLLHFRSVACRAFAAARGDPRPGPAHLNVAFRDPLDPTPDRGAVTAGSELALRGRNGAPLTLVDPPDLAPSEAQIEAIAAAIDRTPRGVILAGRQSRAELREPVAELARRTGYPILAEPTSQLRLGPHDRSAVVCGYDGIASDEAARRELEPELVVRFGELPTSKALREWIGGLQATDQVILDDGFGWYEPTRIAGRIVRADAVRTASRLAAAVAQRGDGSYAGAWLAADRRQAEAASGPGPGQAPDAAGLHRALAGCYRDGDLVYTASSLPIREQERHLPAGPADVTFLANRGANGIDGLVSSGIGACLATGRPTVIVTGDVGLLHDLGALASVKLAAAPVRILVIDNGGGAIFDGLAQKLTMPAAEYEALMRTPPGLDLSRAAALFDLPHLRVTDLGDLPAALDSGTCLIEVPLPGSRSQS